MSVQGQSLQSRRGHLDTAGPQAYCSVIMAEGQQGIELKGICRADGWQRVIALIVFLGIVLSFGVLWLFGTDRIDPGRVLPPCGFEQRHQLPCPTCGFTRSAMAFAQGNFAESFYMQPAAGLMCTVVAAAGFFALLTAACGIYLRFIFEFWKSIRNGYVFVALLIIVAAGWAVTLARALAARN